eukprot:1814318-Prymnesium_polylepis.2
MRSPATIATRVQIGRRWARWWGGPAGRPPVVPADKRCAPDTGTGSGRQGNKQVDNSMRFVCQPVPLHQQAHALQPRGVACGLWRAGGRAALPALGPATRHRGVHGSTIAF